MWKRRRKEKDESLRLWRAIEDARSGQPQPADPTADLMPLIGLVGEAYAAEDERGPEDASLARLRAAVDTDESIRYRDLSNRWQPWARAALAAGWAVTVLGFSLYAYERGRNEALQASVLDLKARLAVATAPRPAPVRVQEVAPKPEPKKTPPKPAKSSERKEDKSAVEAARRAREMDLELAALLEKGPASASDEQAQARLMDYAKMEVSQGDWQGALKTLEAAVAAAPQSQRALDALERAARISSEKLNDPQRSLGYYSQLVSLARHFIARNADPVQVEPLRERIARAEFSVGLLKGDREPARQGGDGGFGTPE